MLSLSNISRALKCVFVLRVRVRSEFTIRFHEHDHADSTALIDSTRFALVPV